MSGRLSSSCFFSLISKELYKMVGRMVAYILELGGIKYRWIKQVKKVLEMSV